MALDQITAGPSDGYVSQGGTPYNPNLLNYISGHPVSAAAQAKTDAYYRDPNFHPITPDQYSVDPAVTVQSPQDQQPTQSLLAPNSFGSGASSGFDAAHNATIKSVWDKYASGGYTPSEMTDLMTQYGVNYTDMSNATGKSVAELLSMLPQSAATPAATQAQAPGIINTPPVFTPGVGYRQNQTPGPLTATAQYGNAPVGVAGLGALVPQQWQTPLTDNLYKRKLGALSNT